STVWSARLQRYRRQNTPARHRRTCSQTAEPRWTACREAPELAWSLSALPQNRSHPQPPRARRFSDILQVLRHHILKGGIDLPTHLTLRVVRDADPARLRYPFKAGGDIDAVAKDIGFIDNDVADLDADPVFKPPDLG